MSDVIRIAIISHALVEKVNRRRWEKLAEEDGFEVHLIIPEYWETDWLKEKKVYEPDEIHKNQFHVHTLPTTSKKNWCRYFFVSIDAKFREIDPDLIYIIHEETIWIHHQIYLYKKLWAPDAKTIFFSMNAMGVSDKRFYHKWMWKNIKKNTDAALGHYPGCLNSLREGNYNKPIYLQTQVGVDEELFKPDKLIRKKIRKDLGFEDKFVIGYTGRLVEDKGVDDLVSILPLEDVNWGLLLVGNGDLKEEIEEVIIENDWEDRIHITGFVDQDKVPNYMNAMDCFVLGSKTMPHWIDTFPLVTVQAQACGIPVVASDSGSLPWQLDDTALIYPEGNRKKLKSSILKYINDPELRNKKAEEGRKRSLCYFCHEGMTKNFKKIVSQVLNKDFIYHQESEDYKQWKAY